MPKKIRLDQLLLNKKLVKSINEATNLINKRKVRIKNYNSKFLFNHTIWIFNKLTSVICIYFNIIFC